MPKLTFPALMLCFAAACGTSAKAPVEDTLAAGKADTSSWKTVATIAYGQSVGARYTSTPRYRAVEFQGGAGDKVDLWVWSYDGSGDAVTWLLDPALKTVAFNDDATSSTYDSHITATLAQTGTYSIVFRDYDMNSTTFYVDLSGTRAATDCRSAGCGTGKYCAFCWGAWACIPENAVC